jgi:hypothetical protein
LDTCQAFVCAVDVVTSVGIRGQLSGEREDAQSCVSSGLQCQPWAVKFGSKELE